jgi:hypothetical protein
MLNVFVLSVIMLSVVMLNDVMLSFMAPCLWPVRVTRRFEKNCQIFQKVAQKVAKSKKGQNIYNKAQFESPKHLEETTFETLKVAQFPKNHPSWS